MLDGTDPKQVIATLKSTIPDLMQKGRIPGLQAALIHDGEIIWTQGFGVMNTTSKEPVTDETIFEAASLTKPMFAYAVMKMVDEGLLDLSMPIIDYLPNELVEAHLGHPLKEPEFRRDWFVTINANHVLSHSAGMPHGEGGDVFPLFFEPGTSYKYSADGYYLLQRAVEHLKGQPLEDIIDHYVLTPLGMNDSWMVWKDEYESRMASGHDGFGQTQDFRKRAESHAGASLYTTASDYARFVAAVLNRQDLGSASVERFLTPHIDVDEDRGLTWSLGFALQQDDYGKAFWQWGDYGIFRNYILAYPERKMALIYLTNSFNGLSICSDLVAASLGGKAHGNDFLGYRQHDHATLQFKWAIVEQGPDVIGELLPKLKAQHPEALSVDDLRNLARNLYDAAMLEEAMALITFLASEYPEDLMVQVYLARAYLEQGDHSRAREAYRKVQAGEPEDESAVASVQWGLDYIQAMEEPADLSDDYLGSLAGTYGPRELIHRDGALHYRRVGSDVTASARRLVPLSRDTFMLMDYVPFRIKFEFDESGRAVKILGIYENGFRDESIRD